MTKIRIGLKYGIAVLAMVLFVAFAIGCVSGTDGTSLEDAYKAAIEDAKIANESEISDLIPIVESNDYLIWKGEPGNKRVLVLTLVPYAYSSTYVGHEGENLTISWGYSWVTVVPEVKEFIQNCTVSEENLTLRVEQLLGLPPKNESKICVELWVDPDDLFRPCPDSGITYTESQLDFPANVSRDHVMWFFECLTSVYYGDTFYKGLMPFNHTGAQRCPWTRLGYTYDWSNPESEIGASEFVIRKNSVVTIESASNTSDYFSVAPSFDPELAQKLQTALDSAVSDEGVPGAVMAVETPKGVWIGAAGKADLSTGRAMTADTQVRIASITKPFTAALILKLVEEGKLHLNDTLEHLLPRAVPYGDQITVAMLLSHTSGIPDHENTQEWSDRMLADPTAPWSSEDVLAIIRNHEAEFEQPGKNYSYCNTGYYLLGMIAEAATGNTVANEINNRFFQPIGMSRTAITRAGKKTEPYAHDYCWVEDQLMDTSSWDLSWDWTAGSAVTTAGNMLIWTRAFFGGEVVSTATLEQMITPIPPAAEYGFGLAIRDSEPLFGERLVHHSGANPGVHAQWLYYPDSNRTIFVALNRQDCSEPPQVDVGAVMSSILTDVCDILKETEVDASAISEEVDSIITAPKYHHSTWGILFEDLETGEVIYELNADKLFIPASVTKLYSTAVALDTLGADYRFRTPIYRTGEVCDLVLVASGDMTMGGRDLDGHIEYISIDHCDANGLEGAILTEQDPVNGLNQLARQVADSGINNVSDVIIDDRLFEEMRFEEYVVSPIMINDNLIDIVITPTNEGELATVEWRPHTVLYNVSSSVETIAAGSQAQIEITSETGTINVKGQIPVGNDPLVRVCRVENPATFARSLLIEALEREGVEVTASALSENPSEKLPDEYSNLTEVAVLESLPFSENIKLILKVSQNVHADTLTFLVGAKHGTKDFYEWIHAGLPFFLGAEIDANEISFGDGRGDERSDLVTPRATVKLLRYMNTSSGRQVVFSMFVNNVPLDQTDDMFSILNDQAKICELVYEYY